MNRNISALILIVLAIGIFFTYTQGVIDNDKTISTLNDQYDAAIKNAKQLAAVRDRVLSDYKNVSLADRTNLDKMLPSSVDNIHLIVDVSSLARNKGFSLRNLKAEMADNNAVLQNTPNINLAQNNNASTTLINLTLSNIRLSFDMTASYGSFIDFLSTLESSLRIMDVTKLSVKASENGVYDFYVELNTYWLRQ